MNHITTIASCVEKHQNTNNITVTLSGLLAIAQPWRFFYKQKLWDIINKVSFLFTFLNKGNYNEFINLPLSCHLVGSRLGRKNRFLSGFFISDTKETA